MMNNKKNTGNSGFQFDQIIEQKENDIIDLQQEILDLNSDIISLETAIESKDLLYETSIQNWANVVQDQVTVEGVVIDTGENLTVSEFTVPWSVDANLGDKKVFVQFDHLQPTVEIAFGQNLASMVSTAVPSNYNFATNKRAEMSTAFSEMSVARSELDQAHLQLQTELPNINQLIQQKEALIGQIQSQIDNLINQRDQLVASGITADQAAQMAIEQQAADIANQQASNSRKNVLIISGILLTVYFLFSFNGTD